jgi:hypothetical protein
METKMLLLTVFLLAIICVGAGILWYWQRIKNKKYILLIPSFALLVFFSPLILFLIEDSKLFYCPNPFDNKLELIELDKLREFFSEENGGRYYYTVLIKNPPENVNSIKKVMVQYFIEKESYINSIDIVNHLSSVDFYKYTCETGYFIDHAEDKSGGFSDNTIDMYQDASIGFISARYPCANDSTKYKDIMEIRNEKRDTLRLECDGVYIDNWDMYIK